MGKAPDLKRIVKEDFPQEDQALIEKLAFPLNSHMEQVRNLFSKGINIDNLAREFITLRVQTDQTSKPLSRITFKSTLKQRIRGISVISGTILSNNTAVIDTAPFITFSQNGEMVTVVNIAGLKPETTYEFLLETIS